MSSSNDFVCDKSLDIQSSRTNLGRRSGWRCPVQPPTWYQFRHREFIIVWKSQVQGAINGPESCMHVCIVKGQGFISPVDTGCQLAHTPFQAILSCSWDLMKCCRVSQLATLRCEGPGWWWSLAQAQPSALFPC